MVRKRLRRRKSEDNINSDESDCPDFEIAKENVRKTYSLRQRKVPVVTNNLSDDSDEETEIKPSIDSASDDDYKAEVEESIETEQKCETHKEKTVEKTTQSDDCVSNDPSELIDFEDVIRADIVVNKQRADDYDTLIQRTEIKFNSNIIQGTKRKYGDVSLNKVHKSVGKDFHTNFLDFLGGNDKNNSDNEHEGEVLDCSQMLETQLTENDDDSVGSDDLPLIKTKEKLLEHRTEHFIKSEEESSKYETNSDDADVILLEPPREIIVLDDD